jgi:hypothetical protein
LRYTVEHSLESDETLKERTIGHEVFGREPGYDTAQDPVVRMTAAEVRKRLATYYEEPGHAAEIAIGYPPGSYLPEFLRPVAPIRNESGPDAGAAGGRSRRRSVLLALVGVVVAAAIAVMGLVGTSARVRPTSSLDRFWAPIVQAPQAVLLCIGNPSPAQPGDGPAREETTIGEFLRGSAVRYTDSVTLALLTGELRAREKSFRIRRPAATELKDLREGPVVLIGGFNNPWTLRLMQGLRYELAADAAGSFIKDRDRPDDRTWQVGNRETLLKNVTKTYGLITRLQDPATGHMVVSVSGLMLGTRAAGECLTDPECTDAATRPIQGEWQRNVQIVVEAAVIGEDSGAPRVVAAHRW